MFKSVFCNLDNETCISAEGPTNVAFASINPTTLINQNTINVNNMLIFGLAPPIAPPLLTSVAGEAFSSFLYLFTIVSNCIAISIIHLCNFDSLICPPIIFF